jgi:hypothetical protein
MSKKAKTTPKNTVSKAEKVQDISLAIEKYFWIVIPIMTIVYYMVSRYSVGFYQDDEVAQYINMLQFWSDPWVILGNNPKPGYKIFTVLPALISYDAVLIVNSLFAALAVYFTYVLIKAYNIGYAFFGALILAFQPLFFDLSFRSYSEIFTALLIVLFLLLYRREKFFYSALLCGYIFTVRQEIAILLMILAVIFFRKKDYMAILGLLIFPLLYNILGFFKTGDIMFVLTEMQKVAGLNYKSQGLLHYFKVYIFIVGPVCLSLFLLGVFGFIGDTKNYKAYIKKYALLYIIFVSVFATQMMTMINDGPNPGNWRYLLHISPVCAIFATIGLNNLSDITFRRAHYIITGILAFAVLVFLSRTTDGFMLTDKEDFSKIAVVAVFFVLTLMLWSDNKIAYLNKLSVSLIILAVVSFFWNYEPRKLSPENLTVKEIAGYIDNPATPKAEVLTNHSFISFYSGAYKSSPNSFKSLNLKNLEAAPKGSLIVWESHYGYRPEWGSDVQAEKLQSDSASYKLLKQFVSADRRFGSFVFEKQK